MSTETMPKEPQTSASDALVASVQETLKAAAAALHATADAHAALAQTLRESGDHFRPRRRTPRLRLRKRS